jgi:hypothetical protein
MNPSSSIRRAGARLVLLVLAMFVASCDTGYSFVADNQTSQQALARISGISFANTSTGGLDKFSYVVVVPARTRLVIAIQPFTTPQVQSIEILSSDCQKIAAFNQLEAGAVFVIRDGPSVEQVKDFPMGSPTAARTTDCAG